MFTLASARTCRIVQATLVRADLELIEVDETVLIFVKNSAKRSVIFITQGNVCGCRADERWT